MKPTSILVVSPDGQQLLIATGAEGPFIREFKPSLLPLTTMVQQAEVLSGHRLDASGGIINLDPGTLAREWKALSSSQVH